MLHLLNIYLLSLHLRTLSPMLWTSLKDQLTYPESELDFPIWQWLNETVSVRKKALYSHPLDNSFSIWMQDHYSSIPMVTYSLTDQQAKDIIDFLRENKDYLQ